MGNLFTELNGHPTQEDIKKINETGTIPSSVKSAEEKTYCIIFKSYLLVLKSQIADNEMEIDGEAIIIKGRHRAFEKIKEYLEEDAEGAVDIRNSMVMVEGVDAAGAVSLYRFIKLCNGCYPEEAIDESILDGYLKDFHDEEQVKSSVMATGNGNYCGTLLREENKNGEQ